MKKGVRRWTGQEVMAGKLVPTLAVVLRTRGCSWHAKGGCLMCGYHSDSDAGIAPDGVASQLDDVDFGGIAMAKIYTSGSFLDENEVSAGARGRIMARLSTAGLKKVVVESRPEFASEGALGQLAESGLAFEVAFGLESADDKVRALCVRKGFSFADFVAASERVRNAGGTVRTYLLLKPPYMTERGGMEDLANSIRLASPHSDLISVNPVNVQKGTELERLFSAGMYRPPWYWSLFSALEIARGARVVSFPSGAGTRRGVHNCPECDVRASKALDSFNASGDSSGFAFDCACKKEWGALLEHEGVNSSLSYLDKKRDW